MIDSNIPVVNPTDVSWTHHAYLMWAGAYGDTKAVVFANSFDDAFEHFVEWLDDNAPGLLSKSEEILADMTPEERVACVRSGEIPDHTMIGHTTLENGNCIASWEWGGDEIEYDDIPAVAHFETCEFAMSLGQAKSVGHGSRCDDDVAAALFDPTIRAELDKLTKEQIVDALMPYGAWDANELADHVQNEHRLVWLAASDIAEGNGF